MSDETTKYMLKIILEELRSMREKQYDMATLLAILDERTKKR